MRSLFPFDCQRLTWRWWRAASTEARSASKRVVFSGVQSSGTLHIGNYFGAIRQWLALQEDTRSRCLFSIVDLHSISEWREPAKTQTSIVDSACLLLACGVDPAKCTLFQQSAVPQHGQLAAMFYNLITVPHLARLPQYKDKLQSFPDGSVPLGLLAYPLLQAADVLLYKATGVPVGDDQMQNLQIVQFVARSFNLRYQLDFFEEPRPIVGSYSRVLSLRNPAKKMSKSDVDGKSRIELTDSPDAIREKLKKALTDFVADVFFEPENRPAVSNLMAIHSMVSGRSTEQIAKDCVGLSTAQYKMLVAEAVVERVEPIRQEYLRLKADVGHVLAVLDEGAQDAAALAQRNLDCIKDVIGLRAHEVSAGHSCQQVGLLSQ